MVIKPRRRDIGLVINNTSYIFAVMLFPPSGLDFFLWFPLTVIYVFTSRFSLSTCMESCTPPLAVALGDTDQWYVICFCCVIATVLNTSTLFLRFSAI